MQSSPHYARHPGPNHATSILLAHAIKLLTRLLTCSAAGSARTEVWGPQVHAMAFKQAGSVVSVTASEWYRTTANVELTPTRASGPELSFGAYVLDAALLIAGEWRCSMPSVESSPVDDTLVVDA